MIRMVHFATRAALVPLLRQYQVDPDIHWTWMKAPGWLRKMWDIATRERGRKLVHRSKTYFQHWRYFHQCPRIPGCIDIVTPGLAERTLRFKRFESQRQ